MGRKGRPTINARLEEAITSPSQSVVLELNWTPTRGGKEQAAGTGRLIQIRLQIGSPGRAVTGSWGKRDRTLGKGGPHTPRWTGCLGIKVGYYLRC